MGLCKALGTASFPQAGLVMPAMVIQPRSGWPPVLQMCRTKQQVGPQ
jgi:hypothetical protein